MCLDVDVPRSASYAVNSSQLIRLARVCNHVADFNARNKCLTAKLLWQGYFNLFIPLYRNLQEGMIFLFSLDKLLYVTKNIEYTLHVMRQSAFLVFNPIMVDNYAVFLNCTTVRRASDSMMAKT